GLLDAGKDALGALTISDAQVKAYASQMAAKMDKEALLAPPGNPYANRLTTLTKGMEEDNGLKLNFAVYLVKDVNAFAMADGTIRFFAGLMDMMTDDEIRYVVAHEMGHVASGHTKARMQTALATSATMKAAASSGTAAGKLADGDLGELFGKVVKAQHSQANERQTDDYALQFMTRHSYDRRACVSALEKIDKLSGGGGGGWMSTHPAPRERAERLKTQIG
ncbi:MAG: M48 family metalloprotease, partial [Burkholderiales bacterium]